MNATNTKILNSQQITQKVERIAYQVYEDNVNEKEIILAGIAENGFLLAEKMALVLKNISSLQIVLVKVTMDKKNPLSKEITLSPANINYENKVVILVDDVLDSGRTLIFGLRPFLNFPLKKIRTAVLADRSHKRFPVSADFTGIALATTLQDHINVILHGKEEGVYLD